MRYELNKGKSELVSCIALTILLFSINDSCADDSKSDWQSYGSALAGGTYGMVQETNGSWIAPEWGLYDVLGSSRGKPKAVNANLKLGISKKINDNFIALELGAALQNFDAKTMLGTGCRNVSTGATCNTTAIPVIARTKIKTYQTLSTRMGHVFREKTLFYASVGAALGQMQKEVTQQEDV